MNKHIQSAASGAMMGLAAFIGFVLMSGGWQTVRHVDCSEQTYGNTSSAVCTLTVEKKIGPWTWSTTDNTGTIDSKRVTVVYK